MTLVGHQLGRYRILEQLGSGGMSVVYKGLDTTLDREVAVKVLHPHLAGKEESRLRLAREAKAVAKLHHPNIVEVFDFSAAGTQEAYLVTEYIRGTTLRQFFTEHQEAFEPPELGAMVVHELSAALAQAHQADIIHRDVKPENVMVREDGVLKLMDFGIAKMLDREDKMTITGALVGSPAHMAPEIIEGEEAGPPADVFSLGTLLYLLATHRLPFTANNTTATLKRILDGNYEDPRQSLPTFSDGLSEILATCLARDPSVRYRDAGKLRDALADYLGGLGLSRVDEELSAFFLDAKGYRKKLRPRLTDALISEGERYLHDRRPARALASLNQVLALVPDDHRALVLLEKMNQARQKERALAQRKRLTFLVGAGVAVASLGAVSTYAWLANPAGKGDPPNAELAQGPHTSKESSPASSAQTPAPKSEGASQPLLAVEPQKEVASGGSASETLHDLPDASHVLFGDASHVSHQNASAVSPLDASRGAAARSSGKPERPLPSTVGVPAKEPSTSPASSASPHPETLFASPDTPRPLLGPRVATAAVSRMSGEALPVVIKVRPFGYVRMDGGPRTTEARSQHVLQASPGSHTLSVSCDFCEDVAETINVKPTSGNEFMIAAQLKPSRLSFVVQPSNALVQVGEEKRSAEETQAHPFDVRFPRGFMGGRFAVSYEISAPGFRPAQGEEKMTPGGNITVTRTLEPK